MTERHPDQGRAAAPEPLDETSAATAGELDRLGITSRQHISYEWNGYRYSNATDAIAAAKRAAR